MKRVVLDRRCEDGRATFEEREGGRFCARCGEMQYDLRDATRSQALTLLRERGGRICGRVRTGPSGEAVFRSEGPSVSTALRGAALAIGLAACDGPTEAAVVPEPSSVAAPPVPSEPAVPPTSALAPVATTASDPGAPADPNAPPTTVAVVDHSTDASSNPAHHQGHAHHHAPVTTPEETYDGGMGLDDL